MATRNWVIWIIVLLVVIGAGFGGYWFFYMRGKVSASEEGSNAKYSTQMSISQGWSFISLPYNTSTTVAGFEEKLGSDTKLQAMYRWSGQAWVNALEEGTIQPGIGYLTYFSTTATADVGNNNETDYKKTSIDIEYGNWQLIGNPGLWTTQFKASGSTANDYIPFSGFAIQLTDGTTMPVLQAIAQGYVSVPLFLENSHPSYSYLKLYDLSGDSIPNFSGFWFKSKSEQVEKIVFSSTGEAGKTTYTHEELESGAELSAPNTP